MRFHERVCCAYKLQYALNGKKINSNLLQPENRIPLAEVIIIKIHLKILIAF